MVADPALDVTDPVEADWEEVDGALVEDWLESDEES
jgi:hypothetical protein